MEQETGGNMMQERQYKILKLLYRSDGFVTVERLAADVNCSLKTIIMRRKLPGRIWAGKGCL